MPDAPVELATPPVRPDPQPMAASMVQVLFPVLGSVGSLIFILSNPKPITIVGGLVFMLGSIAMGVAMFATQRSAAIRTQRRNRADYLDHVEQVRARLRDAARHQAAAETFAHPAPAQLLDLARDPTRRFERRRSDADFLTMRLGSGPVARRATLDTRIDDSPTARYDPVCLTAARRLVDQHATLDAQPVTVDLAAAGVVSFVGDRSAARAACAAMVLATACLHAPGEVTIAACVAPPLMRFWKWLRWLPHSRADVADANGIPRRLLAATVEELTDLVADDLDELLDAANRRERVGVGRPDRRLIALIDAERLPTHVGFRVGGTESPAPDLGITVVYLLGSPAEEPSRVDVRVHVDADGACRIEYPAAPERTVQVRPDRVTQIEAETVARCLAPAVDQTLDDGTGGQHGDVELADLLSLDDIGALDPTVTWRPRSDRDFLRVPIGVGDDGQPVMLDLKESALSGMGPHGLVVGATGSGKSELLRSLVLSLAITHHPDRLSFVLVDFKGGATFAGLSDLPHTAGVITNLQDDLDLVDRMHDALFGEMRRRQQVLKDAGNLPNVHEYNARRNAGAPLPPLPSMLVIVDEFSELLAAKPDFADLFVAIGRIGRSIGVHLLLASQRLETGRIRGLESHLSYRIGLRTFSAGESREAIGVPDAFELPPVPGVGYLKVDTTVFAKFKAAFVARPYRRRDPATPSLTATTARVTSFTAYNPPEPALPRPAAAARDAPTGVPTELQVAATTLAGAAPRGHQVWLPPLEPAITLDRLGLRSPDPAAFTPESAPAPLRAAIGLVDRPANQRIDDLTLDLSGADGNVVIVGAPQSGKSVLTRSFITSLAMTHRPDQAAFYCIDFGGGVLSGVSDLPHVGAVTDRLEPERVRRTVAEVYSLLLQREQRFRAQRIDSAAAMRTRRAAGMMREEPLGDVFLVIDGWGALRQELDDLDQPVTDIAARGLGLGIHVILTASRWADIRAALHNSLGTRLELRVADPFDSQIDRKAAERLTKAPPGRGITSDGLQFQTALPRCDGHARVDDLRDAADKLAADIARTWTGPAVPPVRVLPAHVDYAAMPIPGTDRHPGVPIGLSSLDLQPAYLDLLGSDGHLIVFGDTESGKSNLLRALTVGLAARHTPQQLLFAIVDYRRTLLEVVGDERILAYAGSAPAATQALADVAAGFAARLPGPDVSAAQLRARSWWTGPEIVVVVDDYDLVATPTGNPLEPLLPYLAQARDVGMHLVIARRSGGAARALYDPVIQRTRELGCAGLLLSGDRAEGPLLGGVTPTPQPPGRGVLIRRRQTPDVVQSCWLAPPD